MNAGALQPNGMLTPKEAPAGLVGREHRFIFLILPVGHGMAASLLMWGRPMAIVVGAIIEAMLLVPTLDGALRNLRCLASSGTHMQQVISRVLLFWFCGHALWYTLQVAQDFGSKSGILLASSHLILAIGLLTTCLYIASRGFAPALLTLCLTIAMMCAVNMFAERLGVENEFLDREQYWTSRYTEGATRWQSPLLSSWQLSGLARWALPILILGIVRIAKTPATRLTLLGFASVTALAVVRLEYRAGAIPFVLFLLWGLISASRLKALAAAGMFIYMLVAPILLASETTLRAVFSVVPEGVVKLSGATVENVVTLSGRTELWIAAMDDLRRGNGWVFGQGPYRLDASRLDVFDLGAYGGLVQRYSYHQGFLDILFMYGVLIGSCCILLILFLLFKYGLRPANRDAQICSLSLGLVGTANCHDGFFNSTPIMLLVLLWSACGILFTAKLPMRSGAQRISPRNIDAQESEAARKVHRRSAAMTRLAPDDRSLN